MKTICVPKHFLKLLFLQGMSEMERPLDPRARMMGGPVPPQNMPPMAMGTGDVDLRMPPMPVPAPVGPSTNNIPPGSDQ